MKADKLLSILIPAYNYPEGVERIIKPFLKIDPKILRNIEFIISDDSNSARAKDKIKKIVCFYTNKQDLNMFYISGPKSKNPVDNWNELIEKSRGKYKQIIHHDDFFKSHTDIKRLLDLLNSDKYDVYILKLYTIDNFYYYNHIPNLIINFLLSYFVCSINLVNFIGPSACVVFRARCEKKFNRMLRWIVDVDWFYRIFSDSNKIFFSNSISIVSEKHFAKSITNTIEEPKIFVKLKELVQINFKFNFFHFIFLVFWPVIKIYILLTNFFTRTPIR